MRTRISPWSIGIFCVFVVILFTPVTTMMLRAGNDLIANINYALLWEQTGFYGRPRPHFLFQVLLIGISRLIPGSNSIAISAALMSIAFYLFFGLIVYVLATPLFRSLPPRRRAVATILVALALMVIAPINLLTFSQQNLYWGYIRMHTYHNPPMILMKPFALLLFLSGVRVFKGEQASIPVVLLSAGIAFLGTIAKPSYAICFLPALALVTFYALIRKQAIDWRLLLAGIIVPLTVVLFWQNRYHTAAGMGGFVFAPFQVMSFYSDNLLLKLILSILFPAFVLVCYFKGVIRDRSLQLAWGTFLIGVFYTYFLSETEGWTVDWRDANFTWSAEIGLLILVIAATVFFIRQLRTSPVDQRWTRKASVCAMLFTLHLISGVAFYVSALSPHWRDWL